MICSVVVSSCTVSGKTSSGGSSAEIQISTIRRERLQSSSLVNVGWYTDNLDWIRDPDKLEKGLAYFYTWVPSLYFGIPVYISLSRPKSSFCCNS